MTSPLDAVLVDVLRAAAPPNVLLMRFLGEAASEDDARTALARHRAAARDGHERDRLESLAALWAAHPDAWATVRSVLAGAPHQAGHADAEGELRRWAAVFDGLAASAPEAGVALYALADPALLAAATDEIVGLMRSLDLLHASWDALDLGCGIGRLSAALSPHLRSVLGADMSAGMVAEAKRRCARLDNARFVQTSGRDLAILPDASVDLVLAADVLPYLVQAGDTLVAAHFGEFARVLRPQGAVLILNYSYRGDLELDRAELAARAAHAGLELTRHGSRDLALWDAPAFLLRKPMAT